MYVHFAIPKIFREALTSDFSTVHCYRRLVCGMYSRRTFRRKAYFQGSRVRAVILITLPTVVLTTRPAMLISLTKFYTTLEPHAKMLSGVWARRGYSLFPYRVPCIYIMKTLR